MRLLLLIPFLGLALARVPEERVYLIDTPGEYFWFPEKLDSRPCTIHFRVKGTRDLIITFSPRKGLVDDIYQIVIGAEANRFLCLIDERGATPALDQWARNILTGDWQDFFVQLCNGVIIVEVPDGNDKQTIARWRDDTPHTPSQWFVGVTSIGATSEWKIVNDESCGIDGGDADVSERENRERENENRRSRRRERQERRQRQRQEEAARERQRIRERRIGSSGGSSRSRSNRRGSGSNSRSNNRRGSGSNRGSNNQRGSDSSRNPNNRRGSGSSGSSNNRRGSGANGDSNNRGGSGNRGNPGNRGGSGSNQSSNNRRGSGSNRGSNNQRGSDSSRNPNNRRGSGSSGSSNNRRGSGANGDSNNRRGSGTNRRSNNRRRSGSSNSRRNDRDRDRATPAQLPAINERIYINITDTPSDQWKQWTFVEQRLRSPGSFRFKFWVNAESDAHIQVSDSTNNDRCYYEFMIDYRGRNICIIRSGTNVLDERFRNVLVENVFVEFELGWDGSTISLWKDGRVLVEFPDGNPCNGLNWVGVTSYHPRDRGSPVNSWWIFKEDTFEQVTYEISTPGEYFWFPNALGREQCTIHFQVKAARDAVIIFSPKRRIVENIYKIVIGAQANLFVCTFRTDGTEAVYDVDAIDILNANIFQDFWVQLWNGLIVIEKLDENGERITVSSWQDDNPLVAESWYVGLTTGADYSEWRIVKRESCGIDRRDTGGQEPENEQVIRPRIIDVSDGNSRPNNRRGSGTSRSQNNRRGSGSSSSSSPNNRDRSGSGRSANNRGGGSDSSPNNSGGSGPNRGQNNRRGSGSNSNQSNRRGSDTSGSSNNRRGSRTSRNSNNRRRSGNNRSSNNRRGSANSGRNANSNGDGPNVIPAPNPVSDEEFQINITRTSRDQWKQWKFVENKLKSPNDFRFKFSVQAPSDAHIRISSTRSENSRNYYEIMISFRRTNICIIRSGRNVIDKPLGNELQRNLPVKFELGWNGRKLTLWKDGRVLVEYSDRNPCTGLEWVGVTSYDPDNRGNSIDSSWTFRKDTFASDDEPFQIEITGTTRNQWKQWKFVEYKLRSHENFRFKFLVKAVSDAHIRISSTRSDDPRAYYEIMIAYRARNICIIRSGENVVDERFEDGLTGSSPDEFELGWNGRKLTLWKDGRLVVEYSDRNPCTGLEWVGVTSYDPDNRNNRIDSSWTFWKDTFVTSGGDNGRDGGSGGRRREGGGRRRSSSRSRSSSNSGSRRGSSRRRWGFSGSRSSS